MDRHPYASTLESAGVLAVVRIEDQQTLRDACRAIIDGGVTGIEITMSVKDPFSAIELLDREFGDDIQLGVGSVVTTDDATRAVSAGAKYVVSPVFIPEVVQASREVGAAAIAGAFTPTEALAATNAGADIVKIFPADIVGIPFFKAVLAPLPSLKLMPTGGVNLDNAGDWIKAGAVAVGIGSALLDKKLIKSADWRTLSTNATKLRDNVAGARKELEASR